MRYVSFSANRGADASARQHRDSAGPAGRQRSQRRAHAAGARVEPMESRRLLSASIGVDESGVVVATGTEGHDSIRAERVGFDDVRVTVNSLSRTFDLDDVTGFRLNGLFGIDSLTAVGTIANVTLDGGGSFDVLRAGTAPTTLLNGEAFRAADGRVVAELLADRELVVLGTAGNDQITVTKDAGSLGSRLEVGSTFQGIFGDDDEFATVTVNGGDGNDDLRAFGAFAPSMSLTGGRGDNRYTIGDGNAARVSGGSGRDRVVVQGEGEVTDTLLTFDAGGGTDTIVMDRQVGLDLNDYSGVENVENARGHVIGNGLNNRMVAEPGTFFVVLEGRGGNDTLIGNSGSSGLSGGAGNDRLDGGQGDDVLEGGDGDDVLTGGENADILRGGAGNDTFYARDGAQDTLEGGSGTDRAQRDSVDLRSGIEQTIP